MKLIKLMNNAHVLSTQVGDGTTVRVLFSYETPVAADLPGYKHIRRKNVWGNTTGKHITEFGAKEYDTVSDADFLASIAQLFAPVSGKEEIHA